MKIYLIALTLGLTSLAQANDLQTLLMVKTAETPACYTGFDMALRIALEEASRSAQRDCESENGVLQAVAGPQDIKIEVSTRPSFCQGARVSIRTRCLILRKD